jgi:hypothetical protein
VCAFEAEFFPEIGWIFLLRHRRNGTERIIEDNMKLRGNAASLKIENEGHITRVTRTEANEDSTTRSRLPTGKLLTLLKLRVKDEDRTTPYMEIAKFMAWNCSTGENVGRGNAMLVWKMIVDMSSIVHCHWPQRAIDSLFPSHRGMEEHSSRHIGDSQD